MGTYITDADTKPTFSELDETFSFQDDIVTTKLYFVGGLLLKKFTLDDMPKPKGAINYEFAHAIFKLICSNVYERIRAREGTIQSRLASYLNDEDVQASGTLLEELLRTTHDRYKLILVTNLIILRDIDSVSVGNVLLRRVSEDYMTDWPQQHGSGGDSLFAALRLNSPIYESKQKFLEKNRDKTALEIEIEGFHLDDEQSPTFNAAVHGFRRVFAYLFLCECFLSNVKEEQYKIEKPKLLTFPPLFGPPMPWVEQLYYVRKSQDPTFIRAVTRPGGIEYSQDAFVIGSELLAHLKKRCYLDKFNEIFVMGSFGEVGDKIARSVDWFLKAELEKDPTDVIMSLFISLEALLSLGSDPLMSLVDEMAENVAIMVQSTVDERYKWKRKFKKWYETRNDIVHRGKVIEEGFEWIARDLKISVVWSVMGILARMDNIVGYGSKSDAIKQYFDREKLK